MQTRIKVLGVACVVLFVLAAGPADAQQRRGGFRRGASLLSVAAVPQVGTDLKYSDEQTALAKKLADEDRQQRRELFQGFGDLSQEERQQKSQQFRQQQQAREKQLGESLGEEKTKRVRQLALQVGGVRSAFFDRQTARTLNITENQRNQASEAFRGIREKIRAAGQDADARAKLFAEMNETLSGILNDEQKAAWKKAIGEPAGEELLTAIRTATSTRRRSSNNN